MSTSQRKYAYPRLSQDEYNKAKFQAVASIRKILTDYFGNQGQTEEVRVAVLAVTEIVEQFGMRVRGKDQMIKPSDPRHWNGFGPDD